MLLPFLIAAMFHIAPQPVVSGVASFYTRASSGVTTASGEAMSDTLFTCALRRGRLGGLYVIKASTGRSIIVRCNDRGPFVRGRVVDLSRAAFLRIQGEDRGLVKVRVYRVKGIER